jgi:glyoxylase-like metal-dependent hydrolase (beta-lactamase superfamily II)
MKYQSFEFSPFQENTYVLYDESKECVIVDAGNFSEYEHEKLDAFIEQNRLKPVALLQTHNHLDHLFGAKYVTEKYQIPLVCHADEVPWIKRYKATCAAYGLEMDEEPPMPQQLIAHGDTFQFGNSKLEVIHVPGHSAGGVAFYNAPKGLLFCGDILFDASIGRTDLPGGDYNQLITGIKEKLYTLPETTRVFPGHGAETNIGKEKRSNPYVKG